MTTDERTGGVATRLRHALVGHRQRRRQRDVAGNATTRGIPASSTSEQAQRAAYLPGHRRNPLTTTLLGGRVLSAAQQPWFTLLPPKGYGVLTTTGRKTGQPRPKCVRAIADGDAYVLVSLRGPHAAWLHNVRADPAVQLRIRGGTFTGIARELQDAAERDRAREVYCGRIHVFDRLEYCMHRSGAPDARRIRDLHEHWFAVGTPVVVEIRGRV